ncbi:MAG: hypothetical protein K6G47_03170 [Clostridia bacterium]|nr:hypothetical protein [Clostridia bacterium]
MRSIKCIAVLLTVLTFFTACKTSDKKQKRDKRGKDQGCLAKVFFEELDKETSRIELAEELGEHSYTKGSGIIYFCWKFDDESEAQIVFSSNGKIVRVYVYNSEGEEVYFYNRYGDIGGQKGLSDYVEDMGMFAHYMGTMLFDVTGDGEMDICATVEKGSGIVSYSVVVFDPVNEIGYELSGRNEGIDYSIKGTEGGELVITKKRGIEYNDVDDIPVNGIDGRLGFVNDELVFVQD